MDHAIIPECFVDTNLIETLVPTQVGYNHQKGCGTVAKVMKEKFADRFALGIIDKDKNELDYLKEFIVICNKGSLTLHKHSTKHHYIIQISPAVERFILMSAASLMISLQDFDLPSDFELLKRESKKVNSKKDERFKKLFRFLNQNSVEEIARLTSWIRYLKEQNYQADLAILKEM